MKIRSGFVSNSSTSSFLLIESDYQIARVLQAAHLLEEADGTPDEEDFPNTHYGIVQDYSSSLGLGFFGNYRVCSYGFDIEPWLETMTLPQIRQRASERVQQETGVYVPPEEFHVFYGDLGE